MFAVCDLGCLLGYLPVVVVAGTSSLVVAVKLLAWSHPDSSPVTRLFKQLHTARGPSPLAHLAPFRVCMKTSGDESGFHQLESDNA